MSVSDLTDDLVAAFQLEGRAVTGRLVRMGPAIDQILAAHDYPEPVANLLGEACALAALVGASLKFDGRLILQAQGDGPVSFVVADYETTGALRGYCRFDPDQVQLASQGFARPGARTLLGEGVFIMTLDQGPDFERHQGVTPIEGETLALAAETYFAQSEQIPTRVRLAVGRVSDADGQRWRAGGLLSQVIAADTARGDTADDWDHARALIDTLGDDELIDPGLAPERLLLRLFHEEGVRLMPARSLMARCRCSEDRVRGMLASFPVEEQAEMADETGLIRVTCEYCARVYAVTAEASST